MGKSKGELFKSTDLKHESYKTKDVKIVEELKEELTLLVSDVTNKEVKSMIYHLLEVMKHSSQHYKHFVKCFPENITSEELTDIFNAYRNRDDVELWRLVRESVKAKMKVSKRFDQRS